MHFRWNWNSFTPVSETAHTAARDGIRLSQKSKVKVTTHNTISKKRFFRAWSTSEFVSSIHFQQFTPLVVNERGPGVAAWKWSWSSNKQSQHGQQPSAWMEPRLFSLSRSRRDPAIRLMTSWWWKQSVRVSRWGKSKGDHMRLCPLRHDLNVARRIVWMIRKISFLSFHIQSRRSSQRRERDTATMSRSLAKDLWLTMNDKIFFADFYRFFHFHSSSFYLATVVQHSRWQRKQAKKLYCWREGLASSLFWRIGGNRTRDHGAKKN